MRGALLWRDDACDGPVVGVIGGAVVCSTVTTRSRALAPRRQAARGSTTGRSRAMTATSRGDRSGDGDSGVIEAATGAEVARVKLPPTVASSTIVASCGDAGRELSTRSDRTASSRMSSRGRAGRGDVGDLARHARRGSKLLRRQRARHARRRAGTSLIAIARDAGKQSPGASTACAATGPRATAPTRLEVSTACGRRCCASRDAASSSPRCRCRRSGALLAERGDRRLVRLTPSTAALLDRDGVRAYLADRPRLGAVLGDDRVLAGELARLACRPCAGCASRRRIAARCASPDAGSRGRRRAARSAAGDAARSGTAKPAPRWHSVEAIALAGERLMPRRSRPIVDDRASGSRGSICARARGVAARRRLRARHRRSRSRWRATVVACAARGTQGTVRATSIDEHAAVGMARRSVDDAIAAGDVVAVVDADRTHRPRRDDGHVLGELTSDDGGRAARGDPRRQRHDDDRRGRARARRRAGSRASMLRRRGRSRSTASCASLERIRRRRARRCSRTATPIGSTARPASRPRCRASASPGAASPTTVSAGARRPDPTDPDAVPPTQPPPKAPSASRPDRSTSCARRSRRRGRPASADGRRAGSSRSTSSPGACARATTTRSTGADRSRARGPRGAPLVVIREPAPRRAGDRSDAPAIHCAASRYPTRQPAFSTVVDGKPVVGIDPRRSRCVSCCFDCASLIQIEDGTSAPRCAALRWPLHGQEPHHDAEHGAPRARHADRGAARCAALVHREHAAVEEGAAGHDDHAAPAGDRARRDDRSDGHDRARGRIDPDRPDRGLRARRSRSRSASAT